jgi:hypothetical protein
MVLEAKGSWKKEPTSNAGRVHVPAKMVTDSQFPLKEGEVTIRIVGKTIVVEANS